MDASFGSPDYYWSLYEPGVGSKSAFTDILAPLIISDYDALLGAAADERYYWNLNFSKLLPKEAAPHRISSELLDASFHALAERLSGKTTSTHEEQAPHTDPETAEADAENLEQYFEWRINLLRDAWSTPDVSARLGITPQAIRKRIKQKQLLGIKHAGDYRFPRWQFDPHTELGVIRGFSEVLTAALIEPLSLASWMIKPQPTLNDRRPIDALKNGEVDTVVSEVRGLGMT